MAVAAEGDRGRIYLPPAALPAVKVEQPSDLRGIDAPLANDPRNLWCLGYGLDTFDKLFTQRQLVALTTFSNLVQAAREKVLGDTSGTELQTDICSLADGGAGARAYADAVAVYATFAVSKAAEGSSNLCTWSPLPTKLHVRSTFSRQALPMVWDFAEANPFAESAGNFERVTTLTAKVIDNLPTTVVEGMVNQLDATAMSISPSTLVCTDPPYYDNIGYSDLSDFFYVWLRRTLSHVYPSLLSTLLTPKAQELIATPYRHNENAVAARDFFEDGLGRCFARARQGGVNDFPVSIFYAFKQTEESDDEGVNEANDSTASTGWETILEAVSRSGFMIDGTWPIHTEKKGRVIGIGTNALASSIVLSCRPRPSDPRLTTRKEFISALRKELPGALRSLQHGNIAPVDLAQSAIGPGMAVFTRYTKVIESDGSPMTVRTALGIINQVLDEVLAEQEGEFDSDTRWALAWFEQFGMSEESFGVAETLSKAKNTAINGLVEAGVVKAKGGKVKLVGRAELPDSWDPATDKRLTVWETTQHLIRTLETKGESAAAALLNKLGGMGDTARDLAYRLYSICERKKWADEALAYNSLVIAWPELSKLALAERTRQTGSQGQLF
jgi:putative DNA methylase